MNNVDIEPASPEALQGVIRRVTDVASGRSDGTLTSGGSVLVEGRGLRVGGEGSGIWLAPAAENGEPAADRSSWIPAGSAPACNMPSKLLFALPEQAGAGAWRIIVLTRHRGRSMHEYKTLFKLVSGVVTIVRT